MTREIIESMPQLSAADWAQEHRADQLELTCWWDMRGCEAQASCGAGFSPEGLAYRADQMRLAIGI